MALPVIVSPQATAQMDDLEAYIADRSYPLRAYRYIQRLLNFCNSLALSPNRGQSLEHLRPGLRSIGFEARIKVFFQVSPTQLTILGIYYAGKQPGPNDFGDAQ